MMPRAGILGLGLSVPPYSYTQAEIFERAGYRRDAIRSIFEASAIERRHIGLAPDESLAAGPEWFATHYEKWAMRLALEAAQNALNQCGLKPTEIDHCIVTSCTGYLCPSVAQRLAHELKLKPQAKCTSIVGQGCNAALPALERAVEFAERHVGRNVLCVSVEICSAAYWLDERDLESVVGNAIFSDGAAAAIVSAAHDARPLVKFREFASFCDRENIGHMGFRNEQGRLKVLLSRQVPELVVPLVERALAQLFERSKLSAGDVSHWVVHPGGRKILENLEARLHLGPRLDPSWSVLGQFGNMSSATVLFVLAEHFKRAAGPKLGEQGVMLAIGPGLSCETALIEF